MSVIRGEASPNRYVVTFPIFSERETPRYIRVFTHYAEKTNVQLDIFYIHFDQISIALKGSYNAMNAFINKFGYQHYDIPIKLIESHDEKDDFHDEEQAWVKSVGKITTIIYK